MGTRGFVGFVIDGTEKIAYNHYDSYPDGGLGTDILEWLGANNHALTCDIHRGTTDGPVELARKLRVVDEDSEPSDEDIERLSQFYNPNVGGRTDRPTWYQLLRETQGKPGEILAAGVIIDSSEFPLDSLWAEWGYIVDFDANVFEVYRGFQDAPHEHGRFAARAGSNGGYYPCALVQSWPLSELPTKNEFLSALGQKDEDE